MIDTNNRKMRAAMYLRVSTDEQAREGYGLVYQDEKIRAFVESQDYILTPEHIYRDEGYSGSLPIAERPALRHLFDDAEKKAFDVVLVYRLDRFFRKTRLLLEALDLLNKNRVSFRSITESFDTTNITGRFMTTLLGAVAEMERDTIRERTTNGKIASARDGKWMLGTAPYGYKLNAKTKKLEIAPDEAKWVKKFFEWLVYERCPLREIARRANNLNLTTKNKIMNTKRKIAVQWWPRTIGRMLTNEIYTGISYFSKHKKPHKDLTTLLDGNTLRDEKEWVLIPVPPIISTELFHSGIQQLKRNRDFASRKAIRTYLFTKLLYCSKCGFRLKGTFSTPKTTKSEGSRQYKGYLPPNYPCNSRRCQYCGVIAESRLMPIWEALKKVLSDPEVIYEKLERTLSKRSVKSEINDRLKEIVVELEKLDRQRRKITSAYLDVDEIDEKEYKKRLRENKELTDSLISERSKLDRLSITDDEREHHINAVKQMYATMKHNLENASYEKKSKILHLLVERITLDIEGNCADVEFAFPEPQNTPNLGHKSPYYVGQPSIRSSCKSFGFTVKVPLISMAEWRSVSSKLHGQSLTYNQKESFGMKQLAALKARELCV